MNFSLTQTEPFSPDFAFSSSPSKPSKLSFQDTMKEDFFYQSGRGFNSFITPTRKKSISLNINSDKNRDHSYNLPGTMIQSHADSSFIRPSFSQYAREQPSQEQPRHQSKPSSHPRTSLLLNIESIEPDFDEFNEGAKTVSHFQRTRELYPFQSPQVKTLTEINEIQASRTPMGSFIRNQESFSQVHQSFLSPDRFMPINQNLKPVPLYPKGRNSEPTKGYVTENRSQSKFKTVFMNMKILPKIIRYLDCADITQLTKAAPEFKREKRHKRLFRERMFALLLKGLSSTEQYNFWDSLVNFQFLKRKYPFAFTSQFVKGCSDLKEIMKDLDRTLPEFDVYSTEKGKDALLKVLVSVSNSMKDVGYIQGLNSVAGVILFHLKEEEAFWMIIYMLEKHKLKDIFKDDFYKMQVLNYQLQIFTEYYLPDVAEFFNQEDVERISYFATPWFVTIFSYILSPSNVVKAWNLLFTKGEAFLIQLSLALFSIYKEKIFKAGIDNIGEFFKYELKEIAEDDNYLFEEALRFSIPKRVMQEIGRHYQQDKPQLKLFLNRERKLQVEVSSPVEERRKAKVDQVKRNLLEPIQASAAETGKLIMSNFVSKISEFPETLKNIFTKSPRKTSGNEKSLRDEELSPGMKLEPSIRSSKDGDLFTSRVKSEMLSRSDQSQRFGMPVSQNLESEENFSPLFINPEKNNKLKLNVFYTETKMSTLETESQESGSGDFLKFKIPSYTRLTPETSPNSGNKARNSWMYRPQMKINTEPLTPNHVLKSKVVHDFEVFGTPRNFSYQRNNF